MLRVSSETTFDQAPPLARQRDDSQVDSQADGRLQTVADDNGLTRLAIERGRTMMDVYGCQSRGLQNRLRGVRRRPGKFANVHQGPPSRLMTANDSQVVNPPGFHC